MDRYRNNYARMAALIDHWHQQPSPLKQLRGVLEFGPSRMARELGVSRTHYGRLETGERPLSMRLLVDIVDNWRPECEAAGLCVEQFLRVCRPDEPRIGPRI